MEWLKRPACLQAYNQRASFLNLVIQVAPVAPKCERTIASREKIFSHLACGNATRNRGIQRRLNMFRVRPVWSGLSSPILPVLHDHGNCGRAAAILCLGHEWDVNPHSWWLRGKNGANTRRADQ